jgi:hypothetical protein
MIRDICFNAESSLVRLSYFRDGALFAALHCTAKGGGRGQHVRTCACTRACACGCACVHGFAFAACPIARCSWFSRCPRSFSLPLSFSRPGLLPTSPHPTPPHPTPTTLHHPITTPRHLFVCSLV